MVEYIERRLSNGNVIKYRKDPPRDKDGNVVPTKKMQRARAQARKRLTLVSNLMKIRYPNLRVGTKEYGKMAGQLMKKNITETEDGPKPKTRLTKARATTCRKDGKIARCKNLMK